MFLLYKKNTQINIMKLYRAKKKIFRRKAYSKVKMYKQIPGIRNIMTKACTYDTPVTYAAGGTGMTWSLSGTYALPVYEALAATTTWTQLVVPNVASGEEYTFNRFRIKGMRVEFTPCIPQGGTITQPFYVALETVYSAGDTVGVVYNSLNNDNKFLIDPYPVSVRQSRYFSLPSKTIMTNYSNTAAQPYQPTLSREWQDVKSVALNSANLPGLFIISCTTALISTATRAGHIHVTFYTEFADFD